jgi:hypothetical protein
MIRTFPLLLALAGCSGTGTPNAIPALPHSVSRAEELLLSREPVPRLPEPDRAVVLVVIDGLRAHEAFVGIDGDLADARKVRRSDYPSLTPNLHRLLQEGMALGVPGHGEPLVASGPDFVSMPGYMELLGGLAPTGCTGNECPSLSHPTVLDVARQALPSAGDVAVFASWPPLQRAASLDPSKFIVSAGKGHVARFADLCSDAQVRTLWEIGTTTEPWPSDNPDYRPDAATAPLALRYFKNRRPKLFVLVLGDADEMGHRNDYPAYLRAIAHSDAVLGDLVRVIDGMGDRGAHTTLLVTSDHGRADSFADHGGDWPESQRTWLVARGGEVRMRGMVSASHRFRLADIAGTVRALLRLPPDSRAGSGQAIDEVFR